ncbi:hypothetical protein MTR_3g026715 [Medicago truncatula]|uniref:Uncharacterized protein n=1 Tax=Medicago truncatula TaxID=3880 RepID=A0A072UVT6_MEDTR|nr:hypothetical protein MTR_3g026715 [Medicago truncatula]
MKFPADLQGLRRSFILTGGEDLGFSPLDGCDALLPYVYFTLPCAARSEPSDLNLDQSNASEAFG